MVQNSNLKKKLVQIIEEVQNNKDKGIKLKEFLIEKFLKVQDIVRDQFLNHKEIYLSHKPSTQKNTNFKKGKKPKNSKVDLNLHPNNVSNVGELRPFRLKNLEKILGKNN